MHGITRNRRKDFDSLEAVSDELRATLVYVRRGDGNLADAITRHLERGELYDCALAMRADGAVAKAAELFESSHHYAEAAACWLEAREPRRCLDNASKVPREHGFYPSCAKLAVQAATALNEVSPQLERLVSPWRARGPKDTYDAELFLQLGDLYARLGRQGPARSVYEQALELDPASARARLAALHATDPGQHLAPAAAVPLEAVAAPVAIRPPAIAALGDEPGPGQVLAARYRLDAYLGQGASATVYRATDLVLDQTLAVKLFSGDFDPERQARFKREINLARKLSHPHIVRIFDLVIAGNVQGITMELVEGVSLTDFVRDNDCSFDARRGLIIQAAAALGHAHGRGVIHRDVKPENMLVTKGGHLKITDFGIAKQDEDATITKSGAFAGTPYYVSPEQIANFKNATHLADIYSLGVVAYELFTKRLPFDGNTIMEVLIKQIGEPPPRPSSFEPRFPPGLEALLLHLLAKVPEERVQSCGELIERLEALGPLPS